MELYENGDETLPCAGVKTGMMKIKMRNFAFTLFLTLICTPGGT